MNYKRLSIAIALLFSATVSHSASIYKCTKKDKTVIFTNEKCPAGTEEILMHQETDQEIIHRVLDEKISTIKRLIASNQADAAKEYAIKNNLSDVYDEQLALYAQQKAEAEKQSAEEEKQTAEQAQQQQLAIQRQAMILQQQQLELQKQQLQIQQQQQQQQLNNQTYYSYPYITPALRNSCQPPYCSTTYPRGMIPRGMNPPSSAFPQMNPPQSAFPQMNPPASGGLNPSSTPMNNPTGLFNPPQK